MNKNFVVEKTPRVKDKKDRKEFFEKLVLTVTDMMELLSCSERHIRGLVAQDKIPHFYAGRLLRFQKRQVLEWLSKGGTK